LNENLNNVVGDPTQCDYLDWLYLQ